LLLNLLLAFPAARLLRALPRRRALPRFHSQTDCTNGRRRWTFPWSNCSFTYYASRKSIRLCHSWRYWRLRAKVISHFKIDTSVLRNNIEQVDRDRPLPFFSPAAYRIGGCLDKKFFDLSLPFANISLNRNLNAIEKRQFCHNMSYFTRKRKQMVRSAEKRDLIDRE
jgi:hypothetical protein